MATKVKDKKARSSHADLVTYIRVTGKAISKRTWYRRLKLLRDANIEINQTTIYELANLEIALPKLNLQDVQRYYVLKEKFSKSPVKVMRGKDFLTNLENDLEVKFHKSTVSYWFQDLNGYKCDRFYITEDLIIVILRAYSLVAKKGLITI
jgi:hypothetical protein